MANFWLRPGASTKDLQAVLEKGLTELPSALSIRVALVRMLVQLGDTKRALLLAQEASASAPEDPVALETACSVAGCCW